MNKPANHLTGKYISTAQLVFVAFETEKFGGNWGIDPALCVKDFPADGVHYLQPLIFHYHKQGMPAEEHLRCRVIYSDQTHNLVDLPTDFFHRLNGLDNPPLSGNKKQRKGG